MSMEQSGREPIEWDQSGVDQNWGQPPQKKGLGCGCKLLILFGVLSVLLVVACCGGGIWMGMHFSNSVSEDPDVAVAVTEKMVRMDIPAELEPVGSLNVTWPLTGGTIIVGAAYADESTQSLLVLASFGSIFAEEMQQQEMLDQLDQDVLQAKGLVPVVNVQDWETHEKEIEVRGQPVTFSFSVGQDVDSEAQRIEVNGTFEGEDGPVKFWFRADAEKFDEDTIVKTIESIR
ncbi:MAG: hypothetical protein ABIK89_10460 [Planctomycetota bacterium]